MATYLWTANHETGDLTQWYAPSTYESGQNLGGIYNSGNATAVASTDVARRGQYAARLTINTTDGGDHGARLHRWGEIRTYDTLYFGAWFYFPQRIQVTGGWWNIFQFKSRNSSDTRNDPFWILYVGNRSNGNMYLYLRDWINKVSYSQSVADLPVGRWVHIEVYLRQSSNGTGQITVWQDGVEILRRSNITTMYPNTAGNAFGICNYANRLSPSNVSIYVDDVAIARQRIWGDGDAGGG